MRGREGLVQIEVHNVKAHIAWTGNAHNALALAPS